MARLPKLIDTLAAIDGRERPTIEHTARVIREVGLIPTTKRGSGASSMTSVEAVNLLLALNGGLALKDAAQAVHRLRSLSATVKRAHSHRLFQDLKQIPTFGGALEYLIDLLPEIVTFYQNDLRNDDSSLLHGFALKIEIRFDYASIGLNRGRLEAHDFLASYKLRPDSQYCKPESIDRQVVVCLTCRTIAALWRCLNSGGVNEP